MADLQNLALEKSAKKIESWPSTILHRKNESSFRDGFNRMPFEFSHSLQNHPRFEVSHLIELAEFLNLRRTDRVLLFTDDAHIQQGWNRTARVGANVAECLANINHSHSWLLLKDIQTHPVYADVLEQFIRELEEMVGASVRNEITWIDAYLFVSSPGMLTPYHIDHESNFLFQIRGEKTVNLFDPNDRSILTEDEIERYYIGNLSSARFRKEVQDKAMIFRLGPGQGVHQPPLAPHWVQTGSELSVTLSVLFFLRPFDQRAKVYQVNHYLRRLGITPSQPGHSKVKDRIKRLLMTDLGIKAKNKSNLLRFGLRKYKLPLEYLKKIAGPRTPRQ